MTFPRAAFGPIVCSFVAIVACSSSSGTTSGPGGNDGGTSSGNPSDAAAGVDSSSTPTDAGSDASDAPAGGPGIQLTAAGTSYTLTSGAQAAQSGNGWIIQAALIEGATLRSLAIILNKAESDNGTKYVSLTPGTYACTTPGAPPFTWARFQYTTPSGTTYQSPSSPTCLVTLTAFGAVGQPVTGSFSASLDRIAGSDATPVEISGTFEVTRAN